MGNRQRSQRLGTLHVRKIFPSSDAR